MSKLQGDAQESFSKTIKILVDPIKGFLKKYQLLAYALLLGFLLVVFVTYLLVNSGVLSELWLVVVVIALLVTMIVIIYMVRPQEIKTGAIVISGCVEDAEGNRVVDAMVWLKGDNEKTFTDHVGEYRLTLNPRHTRWQISVSKNHLLETIDIDPRKLKNGVIPTIKLIPPAKTENKIILEALQKTEETIGKHYEYIQDVVKPVMEKASGLPETIRRFNELVERESRQGEDSFSNKYATFVYGTLYNYKGKLESSDLKILLNDTIDEVRRFQFAAYTYDSAHTERELKKLEQCWENWKPNGDNDAEMIASAHKALADSIEHILQGNVLKQDSDTGKTRKENWEQNLQNFRKMPKNSQSDIAALVKEWATQWITHVGHARFNGYLVTAQKRFGDAAEQERYG